ncbi:hypothetical protein Chor_002897 [Crotalus horridus]
MMKILKEAM